MPGSSLKPGKVLRASSHNVVQQAKLLDSVGTPWHAVKYGNLEMITKLFPSQCNVYTRGPVGENVFHIAMLLNTPSTLAIARYLVKLYGKTLVNTPYQERRNEHDPPGQFEGETALHIAIVNRDFDMVKFLVQHGADVRARAYGSFFNMHGPVYYGEFPLSFAAATGQKDIVSYLRRHGGLVNKDTDIHGHTALHLCVIHDQPEMYDHLVEYCGAAEHVRNSHGLTSLLLAASLGKTTMFQHIYLRRRRIAWSYGPVTGYSLSLREIDSHQSRTEFVPSALATMVRKGHVEVVTDPLVKKLLQTKWERFALAQFIAQLVVSFSLVVLQAVMVRLMYDEDSAHETDHRILEYITFILSVSLSCLEILDYVTWTRDKYLRWRLGHAARSGKKYQAPLYAIPGEKAAPSERSLSLLAKGLFPSIGTRLYRGISKGSKGSSSNTNTPLQPANTNNTLGSGNLNTETSRARFRARASEDIILPQMPSQRGAVGEATEEHCRGPDNDDSSSGRGSGGNCSDGSAHGVDREAALSGRPLRSGPVAEAVEDDMEQQPAPLQPQDSRSALALVYSSLATAEEMAATTPAAIHAAEQQGLPTAPGQVFKHGPPCLALSMSADMGRVNAEGKTIGGVAGSFIGPSDIVSVGLVSAQHLRTSSEQHAPRTSMLVAHQSLTVALMEQAERRRRPRVNSVAGPNNPRTSLQLPSMMRNNSIDEGRSSATSAGSRRNRARSAANDTLLLRQPTYLRVQPEPVPDLPPAPPTKKGFLGESMETLSLVIRSTPDYMRRKLDDTSTFFIALHQVLTIMHFVTWRTTWTHSGAETAPDSPGLRNYDDIIVSLMILTGFLGLTYYTRMFQVTGHAMVLLENCAIKIAVYGFFFLILDLGFGFALYVLHTGTSAEMDDYISPAPVYGYDAEPLQTIPSALIQLYRYLFGSASYSNYVDGTTTSKSVFITILFVLFGVLVLFLLTYTLLASIVVMVTEGRENAIKKWRLRWAFYVLRSERRMPPAWQEKFRIGVPGWDPARKRRIYNLVFEVIDDGESERDDSTAQALERAVEALRSQRGSKSRL